MYFDDLESREPAARQSDVDNAAVLESAAVGDADTAPDSDRRRVFEERQHGAAERVGFEHGIGIDHEHEDARSGVDAGVDRVRLASAVVPCR